MAQPSYKVRPQMLNGMMAYRYESKPQPTNYMSSRCHHCKLAHDRALKTA